jgi:hypothetical protein
MSTQTPVLTAIVLQVVSSHHLGCPGNYDNNLDLTWLIQVQMGQAIEINYFLSFDVERFGETSMITITIMMTVTASKWNLRRK